MGCECPPIAVAQAPPRRLEELLDPIGDAGASVQYGTFRPASQEARALDAPWVIGYLHFGGKADPIAVGSLIRLRTSPEFRGVFRVLNVENEEFTLMSRDTRHPGRRKATPGDVK